MLAGLVFLAVGHLCLSRFFRVVPYPVAAGFFAGCGWILSLAAFSVMCGGALDWPMVHRLVEPEMLWRWSPGVAFALFLPFVTRRRNNLTLTTLSLLVAAALYHLGLAALGVSIDQARAEGLVLSGVSEEGLWPAFGWSDIGYVDWNVVATMTPEVIAAVIVTVVTILVNVNGVELVTGDRADMDREFRVAGIANLCAAAGGGAPGCQAFIYTLTGRLFGADTPWTGVGVACMLALTLFLGGALLEFIPTAIIGGLLLYIGVDVLYTSLVRAPSKLRWPDFVLVLAIGATIATLGFVEGVGVGARGHAALLLAEPAHGGAGLRLLPAGRGPAGGPVSRCRCSRAVRCRDRNGGGFVLTVSVGLG